ncbi:MAG: hypothetical protein R3F61_23160 [Myxococcota bacterium]
MINGLVHGHEGLAYLLLLSATVSLGLAVANAALGSRAGLVKAGVVLGRRVEPALMGIIGLLGLGAWVAVGFPITTVYLWLGVLAVVAQGALVGMGTKPVLVKLADGDTSVRWRWPVTAGLNAALVYGIFGIMHAN